MSLYMILGAVALVLVGLAVLTAFILRRVVPTNQVDIVQYKKRTVSYGKDSESGNVYYEWPSFLPVLGVTVTRLPVSVFNVTLKDYAAYDSGRLPFLVDVMAFFRVSDSNVAAHRVADFAELQQQLLGVLQGAVRVTLARHKLEAIMEDRASLGKVFTDEVAQQLREWGVTTVKNIEFMDLRDAPQSSVIQNIMAKEQSRIDRESRETVAENNRAAQEREIEAQRQVDLQEQDAQQQVGIRTAEQERAVGIAKEQAQQEVLAQAQTTAEREMDVKRVNDTRAAEIARSVAEIAAEQDRKVTVVNAEAEKERLATVAEGRLVEAQKDAEGIRVKGEAEGAAKAALGLAEVQPQITLAQEIGSNEGYQSYLVKVEQVKAGQAVGVAQAEALTKADVRVIATGAEVGQGLTSVGELFTAQGGAKLAALMAGFAQTEEGAALLRQVAPRSEF